MTKAEVFTKAAEVILSQIDNVENAEFIAEVLVKEAARTKKTYARQAGYETKAQKENKHMAALVINFFLKDRNVRKVSVTYRDVDNQMKNEVLDVTLDSNGIYHADFTVKELAVIHVKFLE